MILQQAGDGAVRPWARRRLSGCSPQGPCSSAQPPPPSPSLLAELLLTWTLVDAGVWLQTPTPAWLQGTRTGRESVGREERMGGGEGNQRRLRSKTQKQPSQPGEGTQLEQRRSRPGHSHPFLSPPHDPWPLTATYCVLVLVRLSDFLACGQWWLPQTPSPLRTGTFYQTLLSLSHSPENQPLCCLEPRQQTELTGQATGWLCPQVKQLW